MKASSTVATAVASALVLALVAVPAARADDQAAHRLGDHPAVVVQRLYKTAGYDYASKFYPHPAGLRLYAEQPRDGADGTTTAIGEAGPAARSVARDGSSSKLAARSGG